MGEPLLPWPAFALLMIAILCTVVRLILWGFNILFPPDHYPCSNCISYDTVWLQGRDSGSTGQARFKCNNCGHEEFSGPWGSEQTLRDKYYPTVKRVKK